MSVSIYDIAKEANVAPSTVSRSLQDHPRIGAKTKARIKALAKKMEYVPSTVAKSLSSNRTWTIGIVITTVADPVVALAINAAVPAPLAILLALLVCAVLGLINGFYLTQTWLQGSASQTPRKVTLVQTRPPLAQWGRRPH